MKYLFLLAFMPSAVFAQKLQLGLNAGMQYNGITPRSKGASGRSNGYISARVLKDFRRFQLGITLDAGKITNRLDFEIYKDQSLTLKHRPLYIIAAPYISPALVLNYKKRVMAGYAYAGIAAGYVKGFKSSSGDVKEVPLKPGGNTWDQEYAPVGSTFASDPKSWLFFGVQVGYTLPLKGRWSLNAELAFRYLTDDPAAGFSADREIYFPISAGVRYGL